MVQGIYRWLLYCDNIQSPSRNAQGDYLAAGERTGVNPDACQYLIEADNQYRTHEFDGNSLEVSEFLSWFIHLEFFACITIERSGRICLSDKRFLLCPGQASDKGRHLPNLSLWRREEVNDFSVISMAHCCLTRIVLPLTNSLAHDSYDSGPYTEFFILTNDGRE